MAVYERTYRRYQGEITSPTWRFLVLPHYIFKDIFKSKFLIFFYALCFLVPLALSIGIYVRNNLDMLEKYLPGIGGDDFLEIFAVDAETFKNYLYIQGIAAFMLTVFIGPTLISRDLANNGLPLYLSRPISRAEYVTGKISVIFILLSLITWIPGLMLFVLQTLVGDDGWMAQNLRVALAITIGSWVPILILALFALALSAWVKWRPIAAFLMLMVFFGGYFFAAMINLLFFGGARATEWGHMVNPFQLFRIVWAGLFGTRPPDGPPVMMAWIALAAIAACLLMILNRKLRAYEVIT